MPSNLRVLNDLTTSGPIDSTQFQRIAVLDLDAGHPLLVTATGTVEGVDLQFNSRVTIRLELRDGSVAAARPESQTSFQAPASPVFAACFGNLLTDSGVGRIDSNSQRHRSVTTTACGPLSAQGGELRGLRIPQHSDRCTHR